MIANFVLVMTVISKQGHEPSVTEATENTEQIATTGLKVKEADFYDPFAQWLKNDLDEVTKVASLGGAGLKSKWGLQTWW